MDINQYLNEFYKGNKEPTLQGMEFFMDKLGHPEKNLKVLHVAGTNGKGSVTEMLTNILTKAGYKVGKFISPHLICYQERISVGQVNITEKEMEQIIVELMPLINKYEENYERKITLFELETTMALIYFNRRKCDFVVLETGLGGLYDCTNVAHSIISIITSIGLDHMQILGNTIEKIAVQKAGIIKQNADTVFISQEESVNEIIKNTCKEKQNRLHLILQQEIENKSYNEQFQTFNYKQYKNIQINLKGKKQYGNAAICLECIDILKEKGYEIPEKAVYDGLNTVIHKGRFETISEEPLVIYDGAHNVPAICNLRETIEMYYKDKSKVFIVSILKSKDYKNMIKELVREQNAIFIFTSGNSIERFVDKEELYKTAKNENSSIEAYALDLKDALDKIKKDYLKRVTFVVGSFYVYGDVYKLCNI